MEVLHALTIYDVLMVYYYIGVSYALDVMYHILLFHFVGDMSIYLIVVSA